MESQGAYSPSHSSYALSNPRFISESARMNWEERYRNVECKSGSRFDVPQRHLSRLITPLRELGWLPLIQLEGPIYPRLMREFYCNLTESRGAIHSGDYRVHSRVAGLDIDLTVSLLAQILEVPDEGDYWYCLDYFGLQRVFGNAREFYNALADTPPNQNSLYTHHFNPGNDLRLYRTFVRRNIFPTLWHKDQVLPLEAMYMKAIQDRRRVNVSYTILRHMHNVTQRQNLKNLPYGAFLTRIFAHFGVPTAGEEKQRLDPAISMKSIGRLDGKQQVFKPRKRQQVSQEEEEDTDTEIEAPHQEIPRSEAGSSQSFDFSPMKEYWDRKFDAIDARFASFSDSINERFTGLEATVAQTSAGVAYLKEQWDKRFENPQGFPAPQEPQRLHQPVFNQNFVAAPFQPLSSPMQSQPGMTPAFSQSVPGFSNSPGLSFSPSSLFTTPTNLFATQQYAANDTCDYFQTYNDNPNNQ